ncbi:MAG: SusC/RagA family TonB-linked outer membrane protein [Leeuwenhoekiella sp.]
MKTKITWLLTCALLLFVQLAVAQQKTITGTVTGPNSTPLPGVNVTIEGTNRGTQTDFDGNYSIRATPDDQIVFSYVGFLSQDFPVGSQTIINVVLQQDVADLEEVVVTSYATISRKEATSASTTITAKSIENRPNASLVQTITGQIPGLDISTASGQPGANSLVQLRGVNSINGNTEPLFLLDGIPINEDNFRSLNPNEIASVTVLKDAGATAIYGSRGANGVVVIKTRTGARNSPLRVTYTGIYSQSGLQQPERYNISTSQEYLRLERTFGAGRGAGLGNGTLFPGTGTPLTDTEIDAVGTTDWLDFFFRTSNTQNHTVNLTSGGANGSQFTSIGYFDQEGVLKNSNLKRFNFRNNLSGTTEDSKFSYGTNVSVNYSKNDEPTSIGTAGVNQNPLFGAFLSLPYLVPEDNPGGRILAQSFVLDYAPFYIQDKLDTSVALEEELKIVASLNGSLTLAEGLVASARAGIDYQNIVFLDSQEPISRNQLRFSPLVDGVQSQSTNRQLTFNSTTQLNYSKSFGKHRIGVGAYLEYFKAHLRSFGFTQNGLDVKTFAPGDGSGFIPDNADNDEFVDTVFANKLDAGTLSYFGSFNYDFDSKYGLDATVRRDASYRFATTNRWATFYSVAARWNISEEDFMQGSVVSNLKLRGSYGTSGNQRITGNSYWSGADLPFTFFGTGPGYAGQQSLFRTQIGNNTLRWETVAQANIGVDFGFWNNRLRGALDVYSKETRDLFQTTRISFITGQFGISANTGTLTNNGVDLELAYDIVNSDDFDLTASFVGNYNKNELQDLPNDEGEIIGIGRNGGPIGEIFAVRYAGVNPANGNLLFLDADGNLTEDPDVDTDRVWLDKNNVPDYQGSFNLEADYKGFFLTTQWNYTFGVDRFDNDYARLLDRDNIGDFNLSSDLLRAWTPDNRITDIPSLRANNLDIGSTRFLRNLDFVRLRFVTVGYSFPKNTLANVGINTARIFVNAENLVTLTGFRGLDPARRLSGSLEYPTPRIVSFGVELGL